jgi:hypothetical protein
MAGGEVRSMLRDWSLVAHRSSLVARRSSLVARRSSLVQAPSRSGPSVEAAAEAAICRGAQRAVEAGGRRVGVVAALALAVEQICAAADTVRDAQCLAGVLGDSPPAQRYRRDAPLHHRSIP